METDTNRATGRTTGLILQALGKAVENPGTEVEFIDHHAQNHAQLQFCKERIEKIAKQLNLDVSVDIKFRENFVDFGVFVKSNWVSPHSQRTPVEEAYEKVFGHPPECAQRGVWFGFQQGFEAAQKND
jgi:hypothetical protein